MKEPLYPVEITQEVLKELKDEKMYHIIYSDGGGESWSGAWIKGHVDVNCISIIYLPLSSTPLKQLSDEEIKTKAIEFADSRERGGCTAHQCLWRGYEQGYKDGRSVSPLKEEKTDERIGGGAEDWLKNVKGITSATCYTNNGSFYIDRLASMLNDFASPQSDHINPIELLEWTQSQGWNLLAHYDNSEMLWSNNYTEGILTTSQLIETFKNRKK